MEGERRKRKLEGEEEESEEQKMEKFFALIRSTKDVRDQLSKEKQNKVEEEKLNNVWNPTFQPEDFIHDYQDMGIRTSQMSNQPGPSNEKELEAQAKEPEPIAEAMPPPPPPPPHDEDKEKASEGDKLDLTLSL